MLKERRMCDGNLVVTDFIVDVDVDDDDFFGLLFDPSFSLA